jgi:hypothetical protein
MANFLKIEVGARAAAMGGAYVALADDISSLYWNPGGLGTLQSNEILIQTTNWILDTKMNFVGIGYQLGNFGVLGLSINSFSSGDIQETTILEPEGTESTYSASDIAAGISFGRQITDRFSAGLTLKYVSEQISTERASTVAIDIGSVFRTNFLNDMRIGFALSNLGGRMQMDGSGLMIRHIVDPGAKQAPATLFTEPWDIPLLFRFGLATDIIKAENLRLTVASEIMDSRDFVDRFSMGGEIAVGEMLFLRGGYKTRYDEISLTLGAGLNLSLQSGLGLRIDYAYVDYGIFESTERYSLILTL